MGPIAWARTWASGAEGESYLDLMLATESDVTPSSLLNTMWDDDQEHERVAALFERYNSERLSAAVDAESKA